jgi:hypothetical protein
MTSSKLILFFIGIILLIVVILSSNKIGVFLRDKFGRFLPSSIVQTAKISPTPIKSLTPTINPITTITPNVQVYNNTGVSKGGIQSSPSNQIPATGPEELVYVIISGSFFTGFAINRLASRGKK